MLAQTGLEDRAGEEVGPALGRQPAAGEHRDRTAQRPRRPAPRRTVRRRSIRASASACGSSSARLAERGTTIVFSTHNVAEAERYAGRVLVLGDGELLFTGTPAELERAVTMPGRAGDEHAVDFEAAFVRFLHDRGH